MIHDWETNRDEIIRRVADPSPFKILTKTLDEPELIEAWITHHAAIVGHANLVIADNGSTHPDTLALYRNYADRVTIFTFAGHHNDIHGHPRFAPLFDAIRPAARFYAVFDTDERLVHIEHERWRADPSLIKTLDMTSGDEIIPTTWLINLWDSHDRFGFKTTERTDRFLNNLIWGKPILPGRLAGAAPFIHNIQFRQFPISKTCGLNLFLLHLTQFPDRRLRANKAKLVSSGFITPDLTHEQIAALDPRALNNPTAARFIEETKLALEVAAAPHHPSRAIPDHLELHTDGRLTYSSEAAARTMQIVQQTAPRTLKDIFP